MRREMIVRLIEPHLCMECRFATISMIETHEGEKPMIFCRRLYCDNWDTVSVKTVERFEEE